MKKLLSVLLSLTITMSCMTMVSADATDYSNILMGKDAESGISDITNLGVTNTTSAEGTFSYVAENYPSLDNVNYSDVIDVSGLSFESGKVYHISFWVKQESTGSGLWPGLRFQLVTPGSDKDMRNDQDYYTYIANGGKSSLAGTKISLAQDTEWHLKSIIYKADADYPTATLRWRGDNTNTYGIKFYLDDISVREVPNPEKYVKSDGTTSLFRSTIPYMCNYYNESNRSAAKDNAQDIVKSQISLKSAVSSDNALTLTFNDSIGAALGECGVETGLIKSGISGATINGTITTSVDAQKGTSTVVVPCEIDDDTVPVTIKGLFDIWGKKIDDVRVDSVEQSRAKGNLLTNAHCEYLGDWTLLNSKTLDTVDKKDNKASFKFTNVASAGYPMMQDLSVSYIDPNEVMRYSAWIKASSAITTSAPLRMTLRVNYINEAGANKNKDIVIGDFVADGTSWTKSSGVFRLSDKWNAYPAQENITGYMVYMINLTGGAISTLNVDNLYLGYDKGLSTQLSGVFYGVDKDGENKNITLAFKSNQSASKSILTADSIDMNKVMLDYYEFGDESGCTETLNNVCVGAPTVDYNGEYTFIKYNISATEAFEIFEDFVFLVRVEGVDSVDGSSVPGGQLETQKTFNGGLLVSYKTATFDGTQWVDSNVYDEMQDPESTVAIMPIIYNSSNSAIAPVGYCAFYDVETTLKDVIVRNYGSILPGQMVVAEDYEYRFQFGEDGKLNSNINLLWWEAETNAPFAPVNSIK